MKKRYTFSTGETIEADLEDLRRLLAENQQYLANYEEVYSSLEDDDYVARGNGFCDRKYSDDFIEGQIEKYEQRVKELEGWIGTMIDIEQVKQWAINRWTLGELHGISHWERVDRNGQLLATPDCDLTVIRLFAYLHDSCRENDSHDINHGLRAAKMIESLRKTLLKDLSVHQFKMLQEACRLHTTTHSTGNPTIDACFDADRLDLGRVGITPDPEKMATAKGKELASQL